MIVGRLRVFELSGKEGHGSGKEDQGKQQTRSHRFPPFGDIRLFRKYD
jgi:hypothetical protein